jgi:hypothetical protein
MQEQDHAKNQAKAQLESIKEMVAELKACDDDSDICREPNRGEAEQRIHEDPLSVEVRSDWYVAGQDGTGCEPVEYRILLCTGGPAVQIVGDLGDYSHPKTARLQYQDWGIPWTDYEISQEEEEILLVYAGCFYFGE